jgi:hypothetical protein
MINTDSLKGIEISDEWILFSRRRFLYWPDVPAGAPAGASGGTGR